MSKKVYVQRSDIHGNGLFAKKNLRKGEIIFIAKGRLKKFTVSSKKDSLFGPNWMSISQGVWLDPQQDNALSFLNHSCQPNVGVRGRVTFVTLRDVKEGEELTTDYSILELDPLWEMKCRCGKRNCRRIIRSIHYLPKSVYQQYTPFVPKYFMKVYNKSHR